MLYQHQIEGAKWLAARPRAVLGDPPGLGKTYTLLTAAYANDPTPPLVACPAIARPHWLLAAEQLGVPAPLVYSYDMLVRGGFPLMRALLKRGHTTLIADESHYLKRAESQRARIILGKDGYMRRMQRAYLASGTPVPKYPSEFATVLLPMFPDVALAHGLRTIADVRARFDVVRLGWVRGGIVRKPVSGRTQNEAEFKALLDAVMLRREYDDVGLDVPPLFWQTLPIAVSRSVLDADTEGALRVVALHQLQDLASAEQDPHVARMRRRLGEIKAEIVGPYLRDQLEDSDEKIVVFAHHRETIQRLCDTLRGFGVVSITGDTTATGRKHAVDLFQNHPAYRVFVGQNIACSASLTLTAARRAVLVEPDWSGYINEQLGRRIARIGQRGACVAQMVSLAGTLDEAIIGQNLRETQMAARLNIGDAITMN